jgi:D-psicose/D-tagatose/L-ribulose 3-epimerase
MLHRFATGLTVLLVGLLATAHGSAQDPKVQVGWCTPLKGLDAARAAGFEYVELSTSEVAALPDPDFEAAAEHVRQVGLPAPVANLFLPATLKVTGQIDVEQQLIYVKHAFARLSRLGTKIVVFGSGGARRAPDGSPRDEAFKQLVEFGRRVALEGRRTGITIAVEPLRRQETNIINSASEGLQLVEAVNDPNFQLMIDFYHLASEGEDPDIVLRAGPHVVHLHMANPQGRVFPLAWDEYDYAPFFANLRRIGYDKRISVEATANDFRVDAPRSISLLRRAFER